MADTPSRARAETYLFLVTFVWGSTFIITKDLLGSIPPYAYIAIRFLTGALLFGAFAFKALRRWNLRTFRHGAVLGILLFAGFALQTVGLQTSTASKSAFITGLMVVFTPLWQVVLERRIPKPGSIVGVVLVTFGLYLLTSPTGAGIAFGDVLTIGCAASFGLYIVYLDIYSQGDSVEQLTFAQFVSAGVLGTILTVATETQSFVISTTGFVQLAYLTVFATVVALYVQTKYQRYSTPTRSAIIFSLEPVLAAVFAYVIAREVLGATGWVGGGIILAGLLVSELSDKIFVRRSGNPAAGQDRDAGV